MKSVLTKATSSLVLIALSFSIMSASVTAPASTTTTETSAAAPVVKEETATQSNATTAHPLDNFKTMKVKDMETYLGRKMTFAEKTAFKVNKKRYVEYVKAEEEAKTNGWAIAGFITSFFVGPLGIIFSAIALGKIKKTGQKGKGLAIAGLVIGIVSTLLILL